LPFSSRQLAQTFFGKVQDANGFHHFPCRLEVCRPLEETALGVGVSPHQDHLKDREWKGFGLKAEPGGRLPLLWDHGHDPCQLHPADVLKVKAQEPDASLVRAENFAQ
jgi:hypothetical protein